MCTGSWADIVLLHLALLSAFFADGLGGTRRRTDGAVRLFSLPLNFSLGGVV